MAHLVNSELKKLKKSLNDLLSGRIVQKLSNDQKQEIYKEVLNRLFDRSSAPEDRLSNVDKLLHFDLMKGTLIKVGKLISEKFKHLDNLANDEEEIKLIQVLNDTIDHPITLPYLIPNLCECTYSSIEYLFRHLTNQRVIEVQIDEKFDETFEKKLNDKIDEKIESRMSPHRARNLQQQQRNSPQHDSKKLYKIYSSNKTSEYYEKTTRRTGSAAAAEHVRHENGQFEQKIDAIASESNKLHQLNQQYRRNKEEMQDELVVLKEKYHRLVHELEEKNLMIEEKRTQFEDLEIELNSIKVQLESIYKQNQLLDSDKSNLSSNASSLQRRIQELERQHDLSSNECSKLRQALNNREEQLERLEREFSGKKSNLETQQMQIRKLLDEEQNYRLQIEQLEKQVNEMKSKYEKLTKEFELKQATFEHESIGLKREIANLKTKLDEKVQENFKLNLNLKECDLKIDILNKDRQDDQESLNKCREEKSRLLKQLEQSNQDLNKLKKSNLEFAELIESKSTENEQLQSDLDSVRNESVEIASRLAAVKIENAKQLETSKKLFANELKERSRLLDELNESLNDLKVKNDNLSEEKKVLLRLFSYIEHISNGNANQQLPTSLNDEFDRTNHRIKQQISLQFEHYLDTVKELKNELKSRELEVNRFKEASKLVEREYEEQKAYLHTLHQKLNANSSQLKIKDCELIHLRDELAEYKVKRNEDELDRLNLLKECENLKSERSSLELLKIELKKQITNHQLRNVELENELQINLNKIIELDKFTNELNHKGRQLNDELKNANEQLDESSSVREQLARELDTIRAKLKELEQSYQNEKEINLNLNKIGQLATSERTRLEKDLNQTKGDNQQLEYELNKIENEFKDYESRYQALVDDRTTLIDLITKYNIILKSHLNTSLQLDEKCLEFVSNNNKTNLRLVKPECLMQVLLDVQNERSELRRQTESLKMKLNEFKLKLKEENDLNQQYKSMIEFNENSLMHRKTNYEKLFKEQKEFKTQLNRTLEENEKLRIEKGYLTEKVLNLDKILESTKEFMERKFEETVRNDRLDMKSELMIDDPKLKLNSLEPYSNQLDQHNEANLEGVEMRLIRMHDSLMEFINILIKSINDYRERLNELDAMNKALNDRLTEMNHLLDKSKDKENELRLENEKLRRDLIISNQDSKKVDNQVEQLTNQITDLKNECLTLQNSIESNR